MVTVETSLPDKIFVRATAAIESLVVVDPAGEDGPDVATVLPGTRGILRGVGRRYDMRRVDMADTVATILWERVYISPTKRPEVESHGRYSASTLHQEFAFETDQIDSFKVLD